MTKVQIITTEQGERLAVLPLTEYERLAAAETAHAARQAADAAEAAEEDAGTARVIAARRRDVAEGRDALLPAAIAEARMAGENGMRAARKLRRLTQEQLARDAGIDQSYLSQLERGERGGPLATLKEIARVLDVDVAWIMPA